MTRFYNLRHCWFSVYFLIFFLLGMPCIIQGQSVIQQSTNQPLLITGKSAARDFYQLNLQSIMMAAIEGADYLELEIVATADNELIVFQDITLESCTDVDLRFPERKRRDGKYYVLDFTLAEIRTLTLTGNSENESSLLLHIPTLNEALALIFQLEKQLHRSIGCYLEIRKSWFHTLEGKNLTELLTGVLMRSSFFSSTHQLHIQSYEENELKHLKKIFADKNTKIRLIQLIDSNDGFNAVQMDENGLFSYNFDWMFSNIGIRALTGYADGIGLQRSMFTDEKRTEMLVQFLEDVHGSGLEIHFNDTNKSEEKDFLSKNLTAKKQQLSYIIDTLKPDAVITKDIRTYRLFLQNRKRPVSSSTEVFNHKQPVQKKNIRQSLHELFPDLIPKTEEEMEQEQHIPEQKELL